MFLLLGEINGIIYPFISNIQQILEELFTGIQNAEKKWTAPVGSDLEVPIRNWSLRQKANKTMEAL